MPWEKGTPSLRPERWREPGSIPGGIEKLSRPFRPQLFVIPPPRASASGLSPGLESPGPLGRPDDPSLAYQASSQSAEDPHPSDAKPGTSFRDVVLEQQKRPNRRGPTRIVEEAPNPGSRADGSRATARSRRSLPTPFGD